MSLARKLHISAGRWIYITFLLFFLNCKSYLGPVLETYRNTGELKDIFPGIKPSQRTVILYAETYHYSYRNPLTLELVIQEKATFDEFRGKKVKASHLVFSLRVLGRNYQNHIRLKFYIGRVYYRKENHYLELHAENCYVMGKKDFKDRFYIIDGWDCDHLAFHLSVGEKELIWLQSGSPFPERTKYTGWFLAGAFRIYPELHFTEYPFAIKIHEDEKEIVFFGFDADRFFRKGEKASLYPSSLPVTVQEVAGDFVFVERKTLNLTNAENVYLRKLPAK